MESENRSAIAVLARAGHQARDIVKLTNLPRATVYRVYNTFMKSGDVSRKKHAPRSDKKRTPRFLAGLKRSIKANPGTPMTTLAKNRNVSTKTVHKAVHEDLGMSSYVRRRRNLLTEKAKAIRAERCPKLLSFLKHKASSKILIWVDEKKFVVDAEVNRQNQRVIAFDPSDVPPVLQTKHPASAMVFGAVASDGTIMDPHFIKAGLRLGTKEYLEILQTVLLPWIDQHWDRSDVVFLQDSAPSHGSKAMQEFLAKELPFFVKAQIWPSNNPDLNILDYFIWGTLQERVNAHPHSSLASLKASITRETRKMEKDKIVGAAKRFRSRIERVIAAGGSHIE